MRLPQGQMLGELRLLEVYVEWDGPRVFSCVNSATQFFLAMWIESVTEGDRWWYAPVSFETLARMRRGQIGPAEIVRAPEAGLYHVLLGLSPDCVVTLVDLLQVAEEDLPMPGDLITCDSPLEHALQRVTRGALATSRGEEIVDVSLVGDRVAEHTIPFDVLASFLRRWMLLLREQARAHMQPFDAQVYGFGAGSFVVRTSSGHAPLSFLPKTLRAVETGDAAKLKETFPSTEARAALGGLLDQLAEEGLGLRTGHADEAGNDREYEVPLARIEELRVSYRTLIPAEELISVVGIVDAASIPNRQFSLILDEQRVIAIDVPVELVEALKRIRLGKRQEFEVLRQVQVNAFGDERNVAYKLVQSAPTDREDTDVSNNEKVTVQSSATNVIPIYHTSRILRRWAKPIARTDIFRTSAGVQFLRLTKSGNRMADPSAWFKRELFGHLQSWEFGRWGTKSKDVAEISYIDAVVILPAQRPLQVRLMISHDSSRYENTFYPATWVHWDEPLRELIRQFAPYPGWITLERDLDGFLWVTFSQVRPEWHGKEQPHS